MDIFSGVKADIQKGSERIRIDRYLERASESDNIVITCSYMFIVHSIWSWMNLAESYLT